jgi:hypothetical protein
MNSADKHLRFGWWALAVFLTLGLGLETLHGFKSGWYLDVGNETRRLMFRLGHAHGTMLALVNIAAALTMRALPGFALSASASLALIWGSVLLPVGFFLGAIATRGGDPGLGILLVPVGALLVIYAVFSAARSVRL